jgi:hypothetical protein
MEVRLVGLNWATVDRRPRTLPEGVFRGENDRHAPDVLTMLHVEMDAFYAPVEQRD